MRDHIAQRRRFDGIQGSAPDRGQTHPVELGTQPGPTSGPSAADRAGASTEGPRQAVVIA